jgi:hypothetical protein
MAALKFRGEPLKSLNWPCVESLPWPVGLSAPAKKSLLAATSHGQRTSNSVFLLEPSVPGAPGFDGVPCDEPN